MRRRTICQRCHRLRSVSGTHGGRYCAGCVAELNKMAERRAAPAAPQEEDADPSEGGVEEPKTPEPSSDPMDRPTSPEGTPRPAIETADTPPAPAPEPEGPIPAPEPAPEPVPESGVQG